jgi:lysophospholipase L1-like esterase
MGFKDAKHLHYGNREKSMGQTSREILDVLKTKILNQECRGATLVILGGSNDIFLPGSAEQIKENLKEIYKLAQEAGMKVITGTLPPLAYSKYSKEWGAKYKAKYPDKFPTQEAYEADLINRWKEINGWIRGYKGSTDETTKKQVGPDEVIDFAAAFEDPNTPGKLKPELRGANGDGVHFADYSEMGKLIGDKVKEIQGAQAPEETKPDAAPSDVDPNAPFDPVAYRNDPSRLPPGKTMADINRENAEARSKVPGGYTFMYSNQQAATAQAWAILGSVPFGSATPFTIGEDQYIGIKEWHSPHTPKQPPPYHWHAGVSVFQKKKTESVPVDESKPDTSKIAKTEPEEDSGDKKA